MKCLPPTSPKEKPICQQLRVLLAINTPIALPDGTSFLFQNKLSYYDTILNLQGRLANVDELTAICKILYENGLELCPMTVWSSKDNVPQLVKLMPGHKKPVKVIRTPTTYCLAYSFFVL